MVKNSEIQNVIIKPANQSDIPQLVALMNSEYARKKTEQYFIWQFFESVYPTVLMTASVGNRIIGMFGLQKRILNNKAVSGQAIDILIDKKWRGKGLFSILANKAIEFFDDLDLLCVFPNQNGKVAVKNSLGWKCLAKIDNLSLDLIGYKYNSDNKFNHLIKSGSDLSYFVYNSEIISWRFDNHPEYNYTFINQNNGNYAFTKVFTDPLSKKKIGDIVYIYTDGKDITILENLINKTIESFQRHGITLITTWGLPHTNLYQVAMTIGFKIIPQKRYFCVKILDPQFSCLNNIEYWHLVQADTEIY